MQEWVGRAVSVGFFLLAVPLLLTVEACLCGRCLGGLERGVARELLDLLQGHAALM